MAALVRLIARRCDQDRDLRGRVLAAIDHYVEARHLVFAHHRTLAPEALENSVGPLLELHETFRRDPVLGRLFGPEGGSTGTPAGRPAVPRAGGAAVPAPAGSLLAAVTPPGTRPLAPASRPAAPARLGTAVEVDMAVLRAARGVASAQAALASHRKRMALLEAASEYVRTGRSAAYTLAAPPVQGIIRQIALAAADSGTAARLEEALAQFRAAEDALADATRTLERARRLAPREARAEIARASAPERILDILEALSGLADAFRTNPVLARIFPPLAV